MNDSGHSWGLLSDLNIDYDQTLAYITDLAGNIIQSTIVSDCGDREDSAQDKP